MFKKKECKNCGKKINAKSNFCPICGNNLNKNSNKEDWGMLGKDDIMNLSNEIKLPLGMGTIFNSLMKNLDKQFKELANEEKTDFRKQNIPKNQGISISISTSGNTPPKIKINQFGNQTSQQKKTTERTLNVPIKQFSEEDIHRLRTLPKKEPKTEMKRMQNNVIYELGIPGVKSIEDISIIKLENSIEIKALGQKEVYSKILPINLPIISYKLQNQKLILELKG